MNKLLTVSIISVVVLAFSIYWTTPYHPNVGDIYYVPNENPFEDETHVKISEIKEGYVRYYLLNNDGGVINPSGKGSSSKISYFVGFSSIYKLKEKANEVIQK